MRFRRCLGNERGGSLPFPVFSASNVLPPFVGVWPGAPLGFSPYPTTIGEIATHLATTAERRAILVGFLGIRAELRNLGFALDRQWIDGSFCENIEASEGRPPGDIDVMSFLSHPTENDVVAYNALIGANIHLFDPTQSKVQFRCDHYAMTANAISVEQLCYWNSLFSHRRNGLWKGYLQITDEGQAVDDALLGTLKAAGLTP
ncbi:DUF6932 family protein [Brevundimonas sp.]|uniref:DUF6932 family protein n=1 Tax=Brevundimonas sp. TaxID=1871086 RepID=UPI003D143E2D